MGTESAENKAHRLGMPVATIEKIFRREGRVEEARAFQAEATRQRERRSDSSDTEDK